MTTYGEIEYMVLDKLKLSSNTSYYVREHIRFLAKNYRAFLLKQKYSDKKSAVNTDNYQSISLNMIQVPAISGEPCECGTYLKSETKVPAIIDIGVPRIFTNNYYNGEITFIDKDRMRYVGYNKYLSNIVYSSIAPDNYLYMKSFNPQFLYIDSIKFVGIFQDCTYISESNNTDSDISDSKFPLEESLIQLLIDYIAKDLLNFVYNKKDSIDDNNDNISDISGK